MALITKPDYPEAHFNIAHHKHDSDPSTALRHYKAAIASKPTYPIASLGLGQLLHGQGKIKEANSMYIAASRATDEPGVMAEAYVNMAALLGEERTLLDNLDNLENLDKLDNLDNLDNLALLGEERTPQAKKMLKIAMVAQPSYAFAYNKLGMLTKDTGEARTLFEYAVKLAPNLAEPHFLLGLNLHTDQRTKGEYHPTHSIFTSFSGNGIPNLNLYTDLRPQGQAEKGCGALSHSTSA